MVTAETQGKAYREPKNKMERKGYVNVKNIY